MDPTYKDTKLNKTIKIYKKTRKTRIKNKLFKRILALAVEEKGVVTYKDVVLMKIDVWDSMIQQERQMKEENTRLRAVLGKEK